MAHITPVTPEFDPMPGAPGKADRPQWCGWHFASVEIETKHRAARQALAPRNMDHSDV